MNAPERIWIDPGEPDIKWTAAPRAVDPHDDIEYVRADLYDKLHDAMREWYQADDLLRGLILDYIWHPDK